MKTYLREKLSKFLVASAQAPVGNASLGTVNGNTVEKGLLYEVDPFFTHYYNKGMQLSGTPDSGSKRRERFYNLVQLLTQVLDLNGNIVECGCWKGLSSYLLNHWLREHNASYDGKGYHIFDSFEGLSEPTAEDVIVMDLVQSGKARAGKPFKPKGGYAAGMEQVRQVLYEFPAIVWHPGWLPQSLEGLPENSYRFVHVDVDLHEPTLGAIEYFYPRLVPGGLIVCDDYGSLFWPGAQKAVDDFCERNRLRPMALSTGQAVIWKR